MKSILRSTLKASALCSMLFLYQLQAEVIEVQVTNGMDDIEEHSSGSISSGSSDLEMTLEHDRQIVGIRFPGLAIPPGATITNAYIQFFVDETGNFDKITQSYTADLTITAEDSANAHSFTQKKYSLSNLQTLPDSVAWTPPIWDQVGAHGPAQQTSDISLLIQSIVNKQEWNSGNAMAFLISGTGKRVAKSYNGKRSFAPILHIEYTTTDNITPPPAMTETIVADYRMDSCTFGRSSGDIEDATDNHYDATSKNNVLSVAGKINQAASLSGADDYIQLPTLPSGTFNEGITISAWANFDDTKKDATKYEHIVNLSNGLCDDVNGEWCANDYISLWRDGSNNTIRFKMRQGTQSAGTHPHATALRGMHHYVGTFDYDTGKAKIYVDGILADTQDWDRTKFNPDAIRKQNFIGKTIWDGRDGNLSTTEFPFNGKVDEVKLFNGALTATQIQKLYDNENNGKNYDGGRRKTVTCTPQTGLPKVSVADNNCTEGDSGTTDCTFKVALSSAYNKDVYVDYATYDGTANADDDYNATSGTLTIPAGDTNKTITVPIIGDKNVEDNETFYINLSNATAGSGTTNLPQPFAWYKFDETSYNGSQGEVHNSGSAQNSDGTADGASIESGKDGNAASFDGNSMINFGDVLNPGATDRWTISGWINWDGASNSDQQILGKDHVYQIIINSSGHLQYALAPHWAFDGGSSFSVTPYEWTHFTLTYDGTNQKLYKNGTLVYSRPQKGNIGTSSSPLTVGAFHNRYFAYRGLIDDIRMYNQALTESQIQALNSGGTGEGTTLDITVSKATGIILNDDDVQQTSEQNNTAPIADDINVTVDQNDSVGITLSGSDPDNNVTLKYYIVKKPSEGNLTRTAPNLIYTPNNDFYGTDSFTYVVSDGDVNSTEATVTITVNRVEPPVDNVTTITEDSSSGVGCAGQAISLDTNQTVEINGTISDVWQSDRYSFLAHEPKTLNISVKDESGKALEFYVIRNCYEQIKPNDDGTYTIPENCGLVTIMVVGCQTSVNTERKYTVTITQ